MVTIAFLSSRLSES